ncbi:hypothetical protein ES702_01398 [subsurface metagenome]
MVTTKRFGKTTVGAQSAYAYAGYKNACRYPLSEDGYVTSISVHITVPEIGIDFGARAAIYDEDKKLVVQSTRQFVMTSGWKTFSVSRTFLKAGDYWLAWKVQSRRIVRYDSGGIGQTIRNAEAFDGFSSLFGTAEQFNTAVSIYATYEPSKGTLNVYAVADSETVKASVQVKETQQQENTPFSLRLEPGTYTLTATYEDQTLTKIITIEAGETSTVTFPFTLMHTLTIVSAPIPTLPFTLNGADVVTPFNQKMPQGTYTLIVPSQVTFGGVVYNFLQWENESTSRTRTISLTRDINQAITATYRRVPPPIDEAGPINQRQAKDTLQEVFGQGGDLSPTNPLPTEGTGKNTNPRRYEKDYGFRSAPTTIGAVATALYTTATTPARTAGQRVTVYSLHIENRSGAQAWVWLEIAGAAVTPAYPVANNNTLAVDWPAGLTLGNVDITVNGTAGAVVQISGTEA